MEPALAMQLLVLHSTNVHGTGPANTGGCRAESLKCPQAVSDMTETSWRDFEYQWVRYKRSTGLAGQDITDQLISCCSDSLRMNINSSPGATLNAMTEENILTTMQTTAVHKTNPMVHRNQMRDMKQDENELVWNFASRLKEASLDCKFSIKFSKSGCNTTTHMQKT